MEALEAVLGDRGVTFPLSRSLYKRLEHDGYLVGWDARGAFSAFRRRLEFFSSG